MNIFVACLSSSANVHIFAAEVITQGIVVLPETPRGMLHNKHFLIPIAHVPPGFSGKGGWTNIDSHSGSPSVTVFVLTFRGHTEPISIKRMLKGHKSLD